MATFAVGLETVVVVVAIEPPADDPEALGLVVEVGALEAVVGSEASALARN